MAHPGEPAVKALVTDIGRVSGSGAAVRFVVGDFGAGKTFFLHLVRSIAMEKKPATVHAGPNPDRRLHSSGGQARSLHAELMRNLATRAKPDGGALAEAQQHGVNPAQVIRMRPAHLSEMTGGYDFAEVIGTCWHGHDTGDDAPGVTVTRFGLCLMLDGTSPRHAADLLMTLDVDELPDVSLLAAMVPDKRVDKYDDVIGDDLLTRSYGRYLAIPEGTRTAAKLGPVRRWSIREVSAWIHTSTAFVKTIWLRRRASRRSLETSQSWVQVDAVMTVRDGELRADLRDAGTESARSMSW